MTFWKCPDARTSVTFETLRVTIIASRIEREDSIMNLRH